MSSYLQALKIIELRKSHNYTQKDIGKYLQMSRAGYSQYELGKRTPTHGVLLSLANLYNIKIDELINPNLVMPNISDNSIAIINDPKTLHTLGLKCLKSKPLLDISSINTDDIEFLFNFKKLDSNSRERIELYIKTSLKQISKQSSTFDNSIE